MCIVAVGAGTVRCVIFVRDMHESNIQNIHDMLVVERVKNVFALPAAFYQLILLQNAKLMRNSGLCHIQSLGKIAHAYLCLKKHKQNAAISSSPQHRSR